MANGEMLDELSKLASQPGTIDNNTAMRLLLSAQRETQQTLKKMMEEQEAVRKETSDYRDKYVDERSQQAVLMQALIVKVEKLASSIESIIANPVVKMGSFAKDNPKMATFFLILFLIVANLWFISGFRHAVLMTLGVPEEIIQILNPAPTSITP